MNKIHAVPLVIPSHSAEEKEQKQLGKKIIILNSFFWCFKHVFPSICFVFTSQTAIMKESIVFQSISREIFFSSIKRNRKTFFFFFPLPYFIKTDKLSEQISLTHLDIKRIMNEIANSCIWCALFECWLNNKIEINTFFSVSDVWECSSKILENLNFFFIRSLFFFFYWNLNVVWGKRAVVIHTYTHMHTGHQDRPQIHSLKSIWVKGKRIYARVFYDNTATNEN